MINKVLVAVDGSTNSYKALDFALDLSEKFNASLKILNVLQLSAISPTPVEPPAYTNNIAVYSKDLRNIHEETLNKAVNYAKASKPALAISSELREGEPALEIVEAAKDGSFDVIVIGHKGLGRVKEMLLGSSSEKVAHLAQCPVIIVK